MPSLSQIDNNVEAYIALKSMLCTDLEDQLRWCSLTKGDFCASSGVSERENFKIRDNVTPNPNTKGQLRRASFRATLPKDSPAILVMLPARVLEYVW